MAGIKLLTCDVCGGECDIVLNAVENRGIPKCRVCDWVGQEQAFARMRIEYEPIETAETQIRG